jgi:hypothetical protein
MKSQHWNAVTFVAFVLFVVGLVGAMFFGEYATSSREFVQIPVEEPEFTICQWLMIASAALAVISYFGSKKAASREALEARRNARQDRQAKRFSQETSFINPEDFKEEV